MGERAFASPSDLTINLAENEPLLVFFRKVNARPSFASSANVFALLQPSYERRRLTSGRKDQAWRGMRLELRTMLGQLIGNLQLRKSVQLRSDS